MPDTAVNFNGAYLKRTLVLTGATETKTWLFSAWVRPTAIGGTQRIFEIHDTTNSRMVVAITGSGRLFIFGGSSTFDSYLEAESSTIFSAGTLYHIAFAVDLTDPAKRHVYINRAAESMTWYSYTNAEIETEAPRISWCGSHLGLVLFKGDVGHFYSAPGQYLDLSNVTNLNKFIDTRW